MSLARVAEVLGAATSADAAAGGAGRRRRSPASAAIVLRDVTLRLRRQAAGVSRRATSRIAPGERVALFGASGAGKSTLVQLALRPARADRGVRADRRSACARDAGAAADRDAARLRRRRAVPAARVGRGEPALRQSRARAREDGRARGRAGRGRRASSPRSPTATRPSSAAADSRCPTASGSGSASRGCSCAIRAILVLDEAFSGARPRHRGRASARNLWAAFPDRTALVISHRPVGLAEFDRILFLHDGRFSTDRAGADAAAPFARRRCAGVRLRAGAATR